METIHVNSEQRQLVSNGNNEGQDLFLFSRDPAETFKEAEQLVQLMSQRCDNERFISRISGKAYPRVEWWSTIGASLGLFPRVVYSKRLERENDEIVYESRVEVVHHNGTSIVISVGEAICSNRENRWRTADEYAIKSMSITRATGKAYRIPLSFLAVMAGLEPTPSEEMPLDHGWNQGGEKVFPDIPQQGISDEDTIRRAPMEHPATPKQRHRISEILQDERVTDEERNHVNDLLHAGLSKPKASEILDYFLGKSEFHSGEWTRVSIGVLEAR